MTPDRLTGFFKIKTMAKRLTNFSKLILFGITVIGFFLLAISTCSIGVTNVEGAKTALENAGYHPINVGGYDAFNCSEDDWYKTRFKAFNIDSSRIVTGCVCEGFFKGKTIRLD